MKREKLLRKLQFLLDKSSDADQKEIEKLHKVVKQLKHKQKDLEHRLEDVADEAEQRKLRQDIQVIRLQRKKGAALYRQLKGKDQIAE